MCDVYTKSHSYASYTHTYTPHTPTSRLDCAPINHLHYDSSAFVLKSTLHVSPVIQVTSVVPSSSWQQSLSLIASTLFVWPQIPTSFDSQIDLVKSSHRALELVIKLAGDLTNTANLGECRTTTQQAHLANVVNYMFVNLFSCGWNTWTVQSTRR